MKKTRIAVKCWSVLLSAALLLSSGAVLTGCSTQKDPEETSKPAAQESTEKNPGRVTEEETSEPEKETEDMTEIKPFRDITATELVGELRTGWNLGNTLDATGSGGAAALAETAWGNPLTKEEMIKAVRDQGFNTIRIPVTWQGFTGGAPNYNINPAYLKRVKTVVDYAIDNGMYVILNTHHEEWVTLYNSTYEEESAHLTGLWTNIANEFKGYDEHLIFEGLNEPRRQNTSIEWTGGDEESRNCVNKLNQDFVNAVRATGGNNEKRLLMIPGYAASSSDVVLKSIKIPNDPMIAVSVHAYAPYNFALNTNGTKEWSASKSNDTHDIDHLMETLDSLFLSNDIPVIIGEVGAMNKDNEATRAEWATYYYGKATEYGIPMIWWDNNAFSGNGENFGLFNRKEMSWPYPDLVKAIMDATESRVKE